MDIGSSRRRIGELLIEAGVISKDQLDIALTEQKRDYREIGKILVSMGFVSEAVMREFLSKSYQQDSVDLSKIVVDNEAIKLIPKQLAHRHHVLPITYGAEEKVLMVAMSDIFDVVAMDALNATVGAGIEIKPLLAGEAEIINAIDNVYGFDLSLDGILHEIETGEVDYQSIAAQQDQYSQPLVRLVDALLADAVKRDASDIHFEPEENFLRVRYRIDGVLQQIRSLHKNYWSAIAVRLKVMSSMNIAENRIPQDGRISMNLSGRSIDFRVATQPTIFGENIVLRILDRQKGIVPLEKIGLANEYLHELHMMMARPEGMILVTGPTGSGKTTTLYSLLNYLNTEGVNIMTLEDPVEYHLGMVRQTSVNEAVNLDFVTGIRSMLRQDPDIILVGEIRDEATAEMGFRAAMTGHQVYSTLHTNSAIGAIPRLLDLKVQPDIMADNIIGIIGQRLIRKLCPHCRQQVSAQEFERGLLQLGEQENVSLYHPQGCDYCEGRGYKGRMALMEILRMNDTLEECIANRIDIHTLRCKMAACGFHSLAEDGIKQVLNGTTSLEEITRVVNLTHRL